jgi:transposase
VNHVAIDLGSKESQVCIRTETADIITERKHRTSELPALFKTWPASKVILETSSGAFRLADAAKAAGHEVRVVPATLVKQLGVGERKLKTDKRDARKLSEVSCRIDLPSVHIPSSEARELRAMLKTRHALIGARTALINHVRSWTRDQLGRIRTRWAPTLPDRIRSFALQSQLAVPSHLEQALVAIETLNAQIAAADRDVRARAKTNAICQRLMTVPGIGPIGALSFVATIDNVSRFANAHRVAAYLGLTPGEHSSSESVHRLGITKAGPSMMRFALVQSAWVVLRRYPNDKMSRWAQQVAERRGKNIAAVALARKLSAVLFALWRDNSTYRGITAALAPGAMAS